MSRTTIMTAGVLATALALSAASAALAQDGEAADPVTSANGELSDTLIAENGSLAVFESTRYARGHKAHNTFEINGEHKSIAWDLHDLNRLDYFDHAVPGDRRGWGSILCTDGDHPYTGNWWVPGLGLGYETSFIHELAEFFKSLDDPAAEKRYADFRHALGTQYVCDAVLESANSKQWVDVKTA